jgi:hypothetical protein
MSKTLSGAKASLKLNGVKVAYVGSISITEENTLTDVDVLDQLDVAEHAETAHRVSFTCSVFKIDGNSTRQLGLRTENIDDLLTQPELTMEVYNRIDDRVEYTISGVKFEGGSGSIDAKGLWTGSWNFKGRRGSGL